MTAKSPSGDQRATSSRRARKSSVLQSVPQQEGNPYFLCGAKPGHHLVNIDKAWRRIRKAARIDDVRLHDLRRTTGSWLSQASVDLNLIRSGIDEIPEARKAEHHAQQIQKPVRLVWPGRPDPTVNGRHILPGDRRDPVRRYNHTVART